MYLRRCVAVLCCAVLSCVQALASLAVGSEAARQAMVDSRIVPILGAALAEADTGVLHEWSMWETCMHAMLMECYVIYIKYSINVYKHYIYFLQRVVGRCSGGEVGSTVQ